MRFAAWLIALGLTATAATAAEELPFPPESRWTTLPRLVLKPSFKPSTDWIERAQKLREDGTCSFSDKRPGWTQIDIPFVVLIDAGAQVQAAKVGSIGCPELEDYIAGIVRRLGPKQIQQPEGAAPFWRGSRFVAGWRN